MSRVEIHEAPVATARLQSVPPGEFFIVKDARGKDIIHLRLPILGFEEPEHTSCLVYCGEETGRLVSFNSTIDVIMVTSKLILQKQVLA